MSIGMIEEGTAQGRRDQRRHRRLNMPTRVHLAVIMAVLEGSAAAAITYAGLLVFSDAGADRLGAAGFIAIWAGATYGVLSLSPAQRLLATASSSGWLAAGSRVAILCAFAAAFLASSVTASLGWPSPSLDWRHLLLAAGVLIPLRAVLHATVARLMHLGRLQLERVALVGSAENIARMQREAPVWRRGAQPSAVFTTTAGEQYGSDEIAAFVETCVRRNCASVLLVGQPDDLVQAERIVAACEEFALDVVFVPLQEEQAAQLRLLEVLSYGPANSVRVFSKPLSEFDRLIKRALDLVLAVCALILLMPVMLIAALAIKLSSPGPIFYRQDRLGFNGETFSILKFRSMSVMEDGRAMTPAMRKDPRITPVGSVLRRTSIDELPQLINVLKGQMSLVGPRPHALSHDAELARRFAPYARRKRIKPGITGWAQVNGFRGDTSTQMSIESRTLHDLYYVENWSPALDIWILFLTVFSRKVRQNAG